MCRPIFTFKKGLEEQIDLNIQKYILCADRSSHLKNINDMPADLYISWMCGMMFTFQKYLEVPDDLYISKVSFICGLLLTFQKYLDVLADVYISKISLICGLMFTF